ERRRRRAAEAKDDRPLVFAEHPDPGREAERDQCGHGDEDLHVRIVPRKPATRGPSANTRHMRHLASGLARDMAETAEDLGQGATVASLRAQLRAEEKKLALVQEIGQALSSALDLDRLLALIMEKITILMEADRSTLYLFSDDGRELWSKVVQGGEVLEIRLKVGAGIAGCGAASGETVTIPDAYNDKRFYPAVDLRSGYRTRSILCMPMRNNLGATIGVIQVLNKKDGPFTSEDEALLGALGSQAAVSIDNSKL